MSKNVDMQYPFHSDAIYTSVNSVISGENGRGITRKEATEISKALIGAITKELFENKRVLMPRLGTLTLRSTAPRKGRNPRTGEEIKIKARKTIKFSASTNVKDTLK